MIGLRAIRQGGHGPPGRPETVPPGAVSALIESETHGTRPRTPGRVRGTSFSKMALTCYKNRSCSRGRRQAGRARTVHNAVGTVLTSTDGGAGRTIRSTGARLRLNAVSCTSASFCLAVGDKGAVVTTTDGGSSGKSLTGVSCSGIDRCAAVGQGGVILSMR